MRVVIQRVKKAKVLIDGREERSIGSGMLVLAGFEEADSQEDILWLSKKIVDLRIFNDAEGVMNKSLNETGGELMVISQFTLHARTKKGKRPSYVKAAKPHIAVPLYESFLQELGRVAPHRPVSGKFGAHMEVSLVNDGPVTIIIDTKNKE